MNEPLILGIETSGILCSVAWCQKDQVLLEFNVERKNAHATLLAQLIEKGFLELNLIASDISCLAVGAGPGSFTGLRIGMSYAKGFCYGTDIPLISVTNFEILADAVSDANIPLYALIDARKNNYYTGVFKTDKTKLDEKYLSNITQLGKIIPESGHIIVHEEQEKGLFVQSYRGKGSIFQGEYSAVRICSIGYQKYAKGDFLDLDQVEPLYLQAFAGVS